MMEQNTQELILMLKDLRLNYTAENLAQMSENLQEKSPMEIINRIAMLETVDQADRSLNRRIKDARIGTFRRFEDFDWNWPSSINRAKIKSIFEEDTVKICKNLIFLGPQGVGKTLFAKNLAWRAAHRGNKVRVITASRLVTDLLASGHLLESRLRYYARVDLLVIDELGYLSFQDKAADLLFEVVSRRYEVAPIILTSNLSFKEWPSIFPGAACVSALLDRLVHHCEIIQIQGNSYRKHESQLEKGDKG
jgi:DNA replication protein DnaC